MRRIAPLAAAITSLTLQVAVARADLASGKEKLLTGDYKGAAGALAKVSGKDRHAAQVLLSRVQLRTGDYAGAEATARKLIKSSDPKKAAAGAAALAEVLRTVGRYAEAEQILTKATAAAPDVLRAQWQRGLALLDLGKRADARAHFKTVFVDGWNNGSIDQNDASAMFYTAEAARGSGFYEDANATYREAVDADPKLLEANLAWGHLFLDKYAVGNAEQSFDEVLKIDPKHPDAHAGMAMVKLEQSYDLEGARHHLEEALKVNPKHVKSLAVRASLEIDMNQWDAAKATLAEALKINPLDFESHALLATVHWLRDDMAAYQAAKKKVFAANPEYAEFFHIVARSAVREHRYKEAIDLEKEAVKVDPEYYEAMQAIGTGYLRLGDDKQGVKWLQKAWKGDEYNVRTYNTLELFEEEIPKQYSFVSSKQFRFRYHNDEKQMLHRHVAPVLERAYADMVARYGFTPTSPLNIELFKDPSHYSVRTVGLPNLGALGVCFGNVVTAMSPSVGNINWGMVLWHELAHVFAIQLSKSRVPRWYTEGLSEYETLIARPEWRREHDADLYAAMQDGTLPSVAELNYAFMQPSMKGVVVAYHLSSVTIEYIAQTYGFPKIVEGLKLFGTGLETPAVIKKITGLEVAEFDKRFRSYLNQRLAAYAGSFRLPEKGLDDLKQLEIDVAAKPKDAMAHARLALGHFYAGDAPSAVTAAQSALALDGKNKFALYVAAEAALRQRDLDTAKKQYNALLSAGGDSFDIRGRLAMIARHENDTASAEKQLCAAKKLDPERGYPYMELAEIYESSGRTADALRELETYVMIEQMQVGPLKKLVAGYKGMKNWHKVRTYGEMGVMIDVFDAHLHLDLGLAYIETGAPDKAIFSLQSALMVTPELRRPAVAHIGLARAYHAKKNRTKARAHLRKALKLEPANAEALALKKIIK